MMCHLLGFTEVRMFRLFPVMTLWVRFLNISICILVDLKYYSNSVKFHWATLGGSRDSDGGSLRPPGHLKGMKKGLDRTGSSLHDAAIMLFTQKSFVEISCDKIRLQFLSIYNSISCVGFFGHKTSNHAIRSGHKVFSLFLYISYRVCILYYTVIMLKSMHDVLSSSFKLWYKGKWSPPRE